MLQIALWNGEKADLFALIASDQIKFFVHSIKWYFQHQATIFLIVSFSMTSDEL